MDAQYELMDGHTKQLNHSKRTGNIMGIRASLESHLKQLKSATQGEDNFHQAVDELFDDVMDYVEDNEKDLNEREKEGSQG